MPPALPPEIEDNVFHERHCTIEVVHGRKSEEGIYIWLSR